MGAEIHSSALTVPLRSPKVADLTSLSPYLRAASEVFMNSAPAALSFGQVIGLITFALSMATGQVLFKLGATKVEPATDLQGWMQLIFHPLVITALVLYGAATFLWLWLLQRIPLTTAYPFAALAFVLVPLGGWFFFNESVNLKYVGGVTLILCGVLLTSLSR